MIKEKQMNLTRLRKYLIKDITEHHFPSAPIQKLSEGYNTAEKGMCIFLCNFDKNCNGLNLKKLSMLVEFFNNNKVCYLYCCRYTTNRNYLVLMEFFPRLYLHNYFVRNYT
jgi:uncharacterized protein YeaO (DUF488 family)